MDEEEEQGIEQEEELYTRGRSRSRSMHANDEIVDSNAATELANKINADQQKNEKLLIAERTGPLQQKEIVALKKVYVL